MNSTKRRLSDSSTSEDDDHTTLSYKRTHDSLRSSSLLLPPKKQKITKESNASSRNRDGYNRFSTGTSTSTDSSQEDDGPGEASMVLRKFIQTEEKESEMQYNSFAQKMMRKMGHEEGKGLGKHSQGIVDPVGFSKQKGRRGLGLQILGLEPGTVKWDFSQEIVEVEEKVYWMPEHNNESLDMQELRSWVMEGPKKEIIDDEITFCEPEVLQDVLSCKTIFDKLGEEELYKARTRCNPFETIRGGFFQNRAAMKMANIDAVFDYMFTDPKTEDDTPVLVHNELLYFADVCAGPGGFSEYILWRKKWEAKGFGFTLKGDNDFKLEKFFSGPCESFEPHYGVNGMEGDGNIYKPDYIREFRRFVLENTDGKGVHFMMADGGFSVEGKENIQEILSKQLYLCQCLVALGIVRTGGHFMCKLFDLFTTFSVGLVYLMYRSFKKVAIHKPNTSRPANSERYIVCKWKRKDSKTIHDYLYEINCRMWEIKSNENVDIVELVPLEVIQHDHGFFNYMFKSNNVLGQRQATNLAKIAAFCKDANLVESRQAEMRKKCLEFWTVPDIPRKVPNTGPPATIFEEIASQDRAVVVEKERELSLDLMKSCIKSAYDWRCVVVGCPKDKKTRTFYLGLRRTNVFQWNGSKWEKVNVKLELSPGTLLYGELVPELRGTGKAQRKITTLYIIDAMALGGKDIRQMHLQERHDLCSKFARAMNKPSRPDYAPIKVKDLIRLERAEEMFEKLEMQFVKDRGENLKLVYNLENDVEKYILPTGVLFFKMTEEPWMMALSKSHHRKYWFDTTKKNTSCFECPKDSIADFMSCFRKKLVWWWDVGVQVHDTQPAKANKIHKDDLLAMVHSLIHR